MKSQQIEVLEMGFWSRRKTFRTSSENTYRFAILLVLKDVAKEIQIYN